MPYFWRYLHSAMQESTFSGKQVFWLCEQPPGEYYDDRTDHCVRTWIYVLVGSGIKLRKILIKKKALPKSFSGTASSEQTGPYHDWDPGISGALLVFILDRKPLPLAEGGTTWNKVHGILFPVSDNTYGWILYDGSACSVDPPVIISLLWMFIGGSPMGTAGGVKTTTIAVLILSIAAYLQGRM